MYQLFITLGILVAYCICIGTRYISEAGSWRTVVGISFIWPTVMGFGIMTMPESPRWLVSRGRLDDARRSMARSRGISSEEALTNKMINSDVEEMRSAHEYEQQVKATFWTMFQLKDKMFYRTALMATLQMFQQLTGANYFFYVSPAQYASVYTVLTVMCSTVRRCSCPSVSPIRSSRKSFSVPSTSAVRSSACTSWRSLVVVGP